jgi:excisionase family DNA binding protein
MIEQSSAFAAYDPPVSHHVLQAWELARSSRANMMVIGPEHVVMRWFGGITPMLQDPILVSRGSSFSLPMLDGAGTIVLRDIDTMSLELQSRFVDWLKTTHNTQVISTAAEPLFERVGSTLLDSLYYRLNTVYVEVPWRSSPSRPSVGQTVSIDRAAELLNVSRRTVYNRIREGTLQTIRTLGGSQRVTLESIAQLQNAAAKPPAITWIPTGT